MSDINSDFVERYQVIYQKDPSSKVFAPLAEAYRKMGLLDQALQVAEQGVRLHPHFASGHLSLARIYIDLERFHEACDHLKLATELSSENILAHTLLAETWLNLKNTKEALKAYKMVLFLNPNDSKAQKFVAKLESLTADEYEDEVFEMKPPERLDPNSALLNAEEVPHQIKQKLTSELTQTMSHKRRLERALSLTDAFLVRNDIEKAQQTLEDIENVVGDHPEIDKRKVLLATRTQPLHEESMAKDIFERQHRLLERMLQRINQRRSHS